MRPKRRRHASGEGIYYPARSSTPEADALAIIEGPKRIFDAHVRRHRGVSPYDGLARGAKRSCPHCREEGLINWLGRLQKQPLPK